MSAAYFQNESETGAASASSPDEPKTADLQIERPDWTLFRSLATLGQKSGVPPKMMRRLALKELADNALDAGGGDVDIGELEPGYYVIRDDGPGIDGTPEEVARLFSIDRGLVSSKLWRKPQRGALGNGLRVVAGALIASGGGRLTVRTRGRMLSITPNEDGGAAVTFQRVDFPVGAMIEISFGPLMPQDADALAWARSAMEMAGEGYVGKSSAHWFDADAFYELVHCSGARPVRDLVSNLDGCTGGKAGEIASSFLGRSCGSLSRADTTDLLKRAQAMTTAPSVKRLGAVGKRSSLPDHYAREEGTVLLGAREPKANIPFVVEAWAETAHDAGKSTIGVFINRTPITGKVFYIDDDDGKPAIFGCGLNYNLDATRKGRKWRVVLNVVAPHIPITTDGKEPDLEPFADEIVDAISKAIDRARRANPKGGGQSIKQVVLDNLDEAIAKASGDGAYRFAQRQLLYALRPLVMEAGRELKEENFYAIITDHERENSDIEGMYRDNRGALYQPHTGSDDVALGTLMVEDYERPTWTFNKILYIEKQGFFELLKTENWPERHDCALLTSKGFTSRAGKDLLDLLAGHSEPVKVFCLHDADASGTMIMQTLQEATPARAARLIEIVNLGLDPWEAQAMGLEAESFTKTKGRRPVADYVAERGPHWPIGFSRIATN